MPGKETFRAFVARWWFAWLGMGLLGLNIGYALGFLVIGNWLRLSVHVLIALFLWPSVETVVRDARRQRPRGE